MHAVGHDLDAAKAEAIAYAASNGALFVDDGESLDLMEGAGTLGLEAARAFAGYRRHLRADGQRHPGHRDRHRRQGASAGA